jgi:hypothetical protein
LVVASFQIAAVIFFSPVSNKSTGKTIPSQKWLLLENVYFLETTLLPYNPFWDEFLVVPSQKVIKRHLQMVLRQVVKHRPHSRG